MREIDGCLDTIRLYDGPDIRLMEVCGTHTHNIARFGIRELLPPAIRLISGPGCPVCVTPAGFIDRAAEISMRTGCVVYTFGDMLRVPGRKTSLLQAMAAGGSVRMLYSPLDILDCAAKQPATTFYLTALGFETTLPLYALLMERMLERGVRNIRLLTAVKALMPALYWICENNPTIDGFIGPGHVSAILGSGVYEPLCAKYGIPLAVAGFSFEHIVAAICDLIRQIGANTAEAHNLYPNAVSGKGNTQALALIERYFVKRPSVWRGLGEIDDSGYFLAPEFAQFDAGPIAEEVDEETSGCRCGDVIAGRATPPDCGLFGRVCCPQTPHGPCMVSAEGACGIWYDNAYRTNS